MNPNYNEAQCAQAPRQLQVGEELSQLNNAVAELHEAISALYDRLSPVCVPTDTAKPNPGASIARAASPMAQEIGARALAVYSARDRIREMIHCLDL